MPTQILMPQLGESVHEATVGKWLKREGDAVKEYDPLLEITTDKVDTEITASADGVLLKIIIPDGVTANVGTVLGYIGQPGEAIGDNGQSANAAQVVQPPTSNLQPQTSKDLGFISPVVAKLAAEHKVDLQMVTGTGLGGRITKKDILAFVDSRTAQPKQPEPTPIPSGLTVAKPAAPAPTAIPSVVASTPKSPVSNTAPTRSGAGLQPPTASVS
ncbi:MAG TPA: biotin/lipoyl-containing protein, partial [Anaerolineales bacterium]|nr:biotin/lipoyl-containing protein [Anaerolineales bacterium]